MKASKLKVNLNGHLQKPTTEPFARLIYGNIEVQIPYFAFNALKLDLNTDVFGTMRDVFLFAQDEILVEMRHDMSGTKELNLACWHRDNPERCSFNHSWQALPIRGLDADYIQTNSKVKPDYCKHKEQSK